MPYKIELKYIYGWDDAGWTDEVNGLTKPTRFGTIAGARISLAEFLTELDAAVVVGDMRFGHDTAEYRIVEVN